MKTRAQGRRPVGGRRRKRASGTKGKRIAGSRSAGRRGLPPVHVRLHIENQRLYTLLELSTLLSSTRNVNQLFKLLAIQTSSLLNAERTSIFVYDAARNELWSKVAEGTGRKTIRIPSNRGIAGHVLRTGEMLNVRDAYQHPAFLKEVDRQTGFVTRTILGCPMRSHSGECTGVIEALNKRAGVFTTQDEKMLMSIAALAAVSLENSFLIEGQMDLFESFIESSVHALGDRDQMTYGHTIRVAYFADKLARAISDCRHTPFDKITFSEEDLRKLRFAALLHDIGKITVPEAILNKRDKLFDHEVEQIRQRFDHIKLAEKIRALENGGADAHGYRRFCQRLDQDFELILRLLPPGPVSDADRQVLDGMCRTIYRINGRDVPQLTEREYRHLVLARGNLTEDEFELMKAHVKKTWDILAKIYWPKDLKQIPVWASSHHERMDGTGYPLGLKAAEIPIEGQILAVADIFDALTATDRPYKKRNSISEAKNILQGMATAGHVNPDMVELMGTLQDRDLSPGAERV